MSVLPLLRFFARPSRLASAILLLAPHLIFPAAAQIHELGVLPGGQFSQGSAISGDGRVAAGLGTDALNNQWLLYWSADQGLVKITPFSGFALVRAANGDGRVLVGTLRLSGGQRAFRWDAASGVVELGTFGGATSQAWGVSADGRVIVGDAANSSTVRRAFRWTAEQGLQELGGLTATAMSSAFAVSNDGAVVVGTSASSDSRSGNRAVRWLGGTLLDLGSLDPSAGSGALGTNADGSVVVGASGVYAFRWTEASGMVDLGSLGGGFAAAQDVSADGSVVVGTSTLADGSDRAFRWTAQTGMVSLGLLNGGSYSMADGISDDGSVIVGTADNAHGARAVIWKASVLQDLGHVQGSVVSSADSSAQLLNIQARRARGLAEKLCIPGVAQRYCLSLSGAMTYGEGDEHNGQAAGVIGGGMRLDSQFSLGASVGLARARWQANDARQDSELGLAAWLAYEQSSQTRTGWHGRLSVATAGGDSRFKRGERGADVQQAVTAVGMRANAARIALGYGIALERVLLTPELGISHVHSRREGFVERNVVLPLHVDGSHSADTYATLALRGETALNERASLYWVTALDTLLNKQEPDFQGHSDIPGLNHFALSSGLEKRRLQPSLTAGYSYAISESASVGGQAQVAAATYQQQRPIYGLEMEYRYSF